MIETMKELANATDMVVVEKKDVQALMKDRLDFGFDSLYFRYAELCDELAAYMSRLNGTDPVKEMRTMNHRKMHFYHTLEQLVHAHDQEETK